MTLTNSCCWPNSFSHLIVLLSTLAITISTPNHLSHEPTASQATPVVATVGAIDDRSSSDNKRYDNLFDFKTDVNNLLFQSHGALTSRKRRDTTNGAAVITPNLILNLSFANITDLMNVSLNGSIASLNLSHNFLSTFNKSSKFENLTALDLSFNRFSGEFHLDDDNSGSSMLLARLDLSSNSLTSFRCSACRSLQTLNLSRNALTKVSIDNLTSLQYLDLSANLLTAIEPTLLRNKSNLSDLILACNRISVINKDLLNQLGELRRLDLSHNDISDIENDALSDLTNLQILDLSFNRLHIAALQTLQNIPHLNRLSVGGNLMLRNALRAFAVTWSIMELDYSHVGLCQVPDSLAQSVRILNLYGNFLNTIASGDFESYPFLHKLILSYNNLSLIEDDALGRLEMLTILHLDHNKLTQIPPNLPSSLIKLYMHNNLIMELDSDDLMSLSNLQVLDLSHNNLIYMPQLMLPALITLSVRSCGLESVERAFLKTSPHLRLLLIDGNLIKCAQPPLIEIEQCYDMQALSNEYINDDYDTPVNLERKTRLLNTISSYFSNDGGIEKCGQWRWMQRNDSEILNMKEIVPNCWNERKLITSFTRTNERTTTVDNKFLVSSSSSSKNGENLSSETTTTTTTMRTNGVRITSITSPPPTAMDNNKSVSLTTSKPQLQHRNDESDIKNSFKQVKLAESNNAATMKALNNLILMKTKQFKSNGGANSIQLSTFDAKSTITRASDNNNNNNSISNTLDKLPFGAIKEHKSKSNEEVNHRQEHTQLDDNKSRKDDNNDDGANGASLRRMEGIDATDQQHTPINQTFWTSPYKSDNYGTRLTNLGWFVVVVSISTLSVLFVFVVVVYVYRCNCKNSSRRRQRRGGRHDGSCEHINEGTRDALSDNFNEEIRSFTIETHRARGGGGVEDDIGSNIGVVRDRNCNLLTTTSSTVNQCDLLPMDILNSTLNQSQVDRSHISMHLW